MKFTKPDQKTIARMTVRSLTVLIETLKGNRDEVVKPYDTQIAYYEKLLEQKRKEEEASKGSNG